MAGHADASASDELELDPAPSTSGSGSGSGNAPPVMAISFEDEDGADLKDAQLEARQIKLDFDRKDVKRG